MIHRLLILGLLLCSLPAAATEYIESFHSDIEVRRNGDLLVTETIVVHAEGKQIRRGIYRDFPTRYRTLDGRDLVVEFELLEVLRDGNPEPHHRRSRANGLRIYLGHENVYLEPGFYEYQLTYRSSRQLGFFDDYDELYWNVTGNDWAFQIDEASARIILPDAASDIQSSGYTGFVGEQGKDFGFERLGDREFLYQTDSPLRPGQGLTVALGWPKGLVDEPSAAQRRAWFYQDHQAEILLLGGSLLLLAYYFFAWRLTGRDPQAGVIVPRYRPPRGYSPASMRYVENMGYDNKCFTSAIISLASKEALTIVDDEGAFRLQRNDWTPPDLAPGEGEVLAGLFRGGSRNLDISQTNHGTLSHAQGKHERSLKRDYNRKYFKLNRWWVIPGIVATLLLIVRAIASLGSEEIILKTVFLGIVTAAPLLVLYTGTRAILRRGRKGLVRYGIFLLPLYVGVGFFLFSGVPLLELAGEVPPGLIAGLLALPLINYLFYRWMRAPTLAGRRLLDKVEGFRLYLGVAEDDELKRHRAPDFTSEIYEAYLPYAIALELENEWTARLDRAIAAGQVDGGYRRPEWYRSGSGRRMNFSSSVANSLDSAISSSSVAPGSSSGSSGGGFSGGGGGGGGGGGW
ncbi:MAG: DUF2207 domain-containing protein [Gammaproteobacteria bacterium]|nr:DUF2207 domain-containing protein [Gammaproteobacteria bacterium]